MKTKKTLNKSSLQYASNWYNFIFFWKFNWYNIIHLNTWYQYKKHIESFSSYDIRLEQRYPAIVVANSFPQVK